MGKGREKGVGGGGGRGGLDPHLEFDCNLVTSQCEIFYPNYLRLGDTVAPKITIL